MSCIVKTVLPVGPRSRICSVRRPSRRISFSSASQSPRREITGKQLLEAYRDRERNFARTVIIGKLNFSEVDLSGICLSGAQLQGINIIGSNLKHADFRAANLEGSTLSGCDLGYANFGSIYDAVELSIDKIRIKPRVTSLRDVDFGKADLVEACFIGADFEGVKFRQARIDIKALWSINTGPWAEMKIEDKIMKWIRGGGVIFWNSF